MFPTVLMINMSIHSSCPLFGDGMVATKRTPGVTWIQITARLDAMQHFYYMVDRRLHAIGKILGAAET